MSWPYRFIFTLAPEELTRRRELLDWYGSFAQGSVLFALVLVGCLSRISFARIEARMPRKLKTVGRILAWKLDDEVAPGWGTWKHLLFWAAIGGWLGILVVRETGEDYMHVTKRFGIVAASQLPLHYLLSAKTSYSPIQILTRLSYEEINPYHQVFGYVLVTFIAAHATLYLNFFIQLSVLSKRIKDLDVQLGLLAISSFLTIATSAVSYVRTYSYRLFYTLHIALSFTLLPTLYFHVPYIRICIVETAATYFFFVLQRYITSQHRVAGTLINLPNTYLTQVTIPLPASLFSRTFYPGQHLFLSRPGSRIISHMNPFSIANNPQQFQPPGIVLIARTHDGSTVLLNKTAHTYPDKSHDLLLQGPYGGSRNFPDLLCYDRVLCIAGGVGATFTLPIFESLLLRLDHEQSPRTSPPTSTSTALRMRHFNDAKCTAYSGICRIQHVWTVRSQADCYWYFHPSELPPAPQRNVPFGATFELFPIYETGPPSGKRPPWAKILSELFEEGRGDYETEEQVKRYKVAILVCGPKGLAREVRGLVREWVKQGREQYETVNLAKTVAGFASDAAAVALHAEKGPFTALEFLEQGRGVLAASLEELRTDVLDLRERYQQLAEQFDCLGDKLELPLSREKSSTEQSRGLTWQTRMDARYKADKDLNDLIAEVCKQPGFGDFLGAPSRKDLLHAAGRGLIVVINVSEHRSDAILVEQRGIRFVALPNLNIEQIPQNIQRNDLGNPEVLAWLWDTVMNPFLDAFGFIHSPPDGNWPHVWWIPTGPLSKFPLHAAGYHDKGSSKTVLDRVMSSYSSSIKTIIHRRRHRIVRFASAQALLVAIKYKGQLELALQRKR